MNQIIYHVRSSVGYSST